MSPSPRQGRKAATSSLEKCLLDLASQAEPLNYLSVLAARGSALGRLEGHALPMACLAWMHALASAARSAECAGASAEAIRTALEPARTLHAMSPFVRRLQTWPEGYPGDWRTIAQLIASTSSLEPGTLAHGIEWGALNTAIAQQHRNKVRWQADEILRTIRQRRGAASILSIGCGGSADIALVTEHGIGGPTHYTLADVDRDALAESERVIAAAGAASEVVHGNILRTIARVASVPRFDLVICGGLLDYLPARQAEWVVGMAWRGVAPSGRLAFTNIVDGNPFRPWMEYVANWSLIERSAEDIAAWLLLLTDKREAQVARDTTGLAWLITATKDPAPC